MSIDPTRQSLLGPPKELCPYRYGGHAQDATFHLLEPYNDVNVDILVRENLALPYSKFLALQKDYTLDVNVESDDVATIDVVFINPYTAQDNRDIFSACINRIMMAVNTNRYAHAAGLVHGYDVEYCHKSDSKTKLTIKTCPEWLTNELEWFMEMMSMNNFELTVADVVPVEASNWYEKYYGIVRTTPTGIPMIVFQSIVFSIAFVLVLCCIVYSKTFY